MRLSSRFRGGLRWSAVSAVVTSGLQFLQLLLLARLLDKTDFGRFAAVSLFFQLCLQIQDCGINNAILHRQENDQKQLSALFWANLALGVFLGTALWAAGGAISIWYDDPILNSVTRKFALIMPFMGAAATFKVLLQKQMDYRRIGTVEMVSSVVSFVTTLWLALAGFGLQSLVWGVMIRYLTEVLLYCTWKPFLRPAFSFRLNDGRFYFRFGMIQVGERLVTLLTSQADTLLIGRLLGMDALGIYDVIKRLLVRPSSLLNSIVERAALPLYARLQHRQQLLKKIFLILLERIATLHFFCYGMLVAMADYLLPLLLGEQWLEHSKTFSLLAAFVFLHCLLNPVDSLLVATGKVEQWLTANLLLLPVLALAVGLGCQAGLEGAILAQFVVFGLFLWVVYWKILGTILVLEKWETAMLLWSSGRPALPSLLLTVLLLPWMAGTAWQWVSIAVLSVGLFVWRSGIWQWRKDFF